MTPPPWKSKAPATPLNGRSAASRALVSVWQQRAYAADYLGALRATTSMEPREIAFATEIALGTLRHLRTIEYVLRRVATYDARRTRPVLRAILLGGAYQMIWMDRVPVFAAVDEAVSQARGKAGAKGAGMVNAILRNLARSITERRVAWLPGSADQVRTGWGVACAFGRPVLPDSRDPQHVLIAAGETPDRWKTLVKRHGRERAAEICWAAQATPPTVLQRQRLRIGEQRWQSLLRETYGDAVAFAEEAAFVPPGALRPDAPPLADGLAYVQDLTARGAVALLKPRRRERVLDFCAAPGGKSYAIAIAMRDEGEVCACDVNEGRLRQVVTGAQTLELSCIDTVLLGEAGEPPDSLATDFDAVLVDVPCSNSGVIARRPEARFRVERGSLEPLVALQRRILERAAQRVRRGGRLVYSTCSIEPEENEGNVAEFLKTHRDWGLSASSLTTPMWGEHLSSWRDGGFAALLHKAD